MQSYVLSLSGRGGGVTREISGWWLDGGMGRKVLQVFVRVSSDFEYCIDQGLMRFSSLVLLLYRD